MMYSLAIGETSSLPSKYSDQSGFTLIELLVVVAVIGVLAAIAIPQFSAYRLRASNSAAQTDLKNAITAQEAFFVTYSGYGDCMNAGCEAALPGFKRTDGVSIACTPREENQIYQCSTVHDRGNKTYYYDSENSVFWER